MLMLSLLSLFDTPLTLTLTDWVGGSFGCLASRISFFFLLSLDFRFQIFISFLLVKSCQLSLFFG